MAVVLPWKNLTSLVIFVPHLPLSCSTFTEHTRSLSQRKLLESACKIRLPKRGQSCHLFCAISAEIGQNSIKISHRVSATRDLNPMTSSVNAKLVAKDISKIIWEMTIAKSVQLIPQVFTLVLKSVFASEVINDPKVKILNRCAQKFSHYLYSKYRPVKYDTAF